MRQASKKEQHITVARVAGYHEGGYRGTDSEAYAYMGFESNKYFTSDRFINLDSTRTRNNK